MDYPISKLGKEQAKSMAERLNEQLRHIVKCMGMECSDEEFKVKIVSSPFLKCLETSHEISKVFKEMLIDDVEIDYRLSDYMDAQYILDHGAKPLSRLWATTGAEELQ